MNQNQKEYFCKNSSRNKNPTLDSVFFLIGKATEIRVQGRVFCFLIVSYPNQKF